MNDSGPLSPFDNGCSSIYFDNLTVNDRESITEDAIDSDDSSCSKTASSSVFGSGIDELDPDTALFSSCNGSISESNECLIGSSINSTCLELG